MMLTACWRHAPHCANYSIADKEKAAQTSPSYLVDEGCVKHPLSALLTLSYLLFLPSRYGLPTTKTSNCPDSSVER